MNRIDATFAGLRQQQRKAFVPYITAGLVDSSVLTALLGELQAAGVSVVELGIPYSDPIADGPVIQSSFNEALRRGVTRRGIFESVAAARSAGVKLPMAAMVSYAIVHRVGPERYIAEAAGAGLDGLIVPDLPLEEAESLIGPAAKAGLTVTLLVAPTTTPERRRRIGQLSSGFVYCMSLSGITGERATLPTDLAAHVSAVKAVTEKPVCVGFGISRPEHVAAAAAVSDGVIVGSALVRRMMDNLGSTARMIAEVSGLVRNLISGLPRPPQKS